MTATTIRSQKRIVVLGAGYAGLLATIRVAGRTRGSGTAVTLISDRDVFVERIRLHQAATSRRRVERPIPELLHGTGASFRRARVVALDPARGEVAIETANGPERVAYDYLIDALGSSTAVDRVPGVREHAQVLDRSGGVNGRGLVPGDVAGRNGRVVVCGGGLTGIELAAEIAETYPTTDVALITAGELDADLSEGGKAYVRQTLARLGVNVFERAPVSEVAADRLILADRRSIPFDRCLWVAGFAPSSLARQAGLAVNDMGQALVDRFLRSTSQPNIYVAGDAASVEAAFGVPIRMACATAMPMGAQAADNVAAEVLGRSPAPFCFAEGGRCISLGRGAGLVQLVHPDGSPRPRIITGRLGAWVKELICRYTTVSLRLERSWPGAYHWPTAGDLGAARPDPVSRPAASDGRIGRVRSGEV